MVVGWQIACWWKKSVSPWDEEKKMPNKKKADVTGICDQFKTFPAFAVIALPYTNRKASVGLPLPDNQGLCAEAAAKLRCHLFPAFFPPRRHGGCLFRNFCPAGHGE